MFSAIISAIDDSQSTQLNLYEHFPHSAMLQASHCTDCFPLIHMAFIESVMPFKHLELQNRSSLSRTSQHFHSVFPVTSKIWY
jgi:hypothetical protein